MILSTINIVHLKKQH